MVIHMEDTSVWKAKRKNQRRFLSSVSPLVPHTQTNPKPPVFLTEWASWAPSMEKSSSVAREGKQHDGNHPLEESLCSTI